MEGKVEAPGDAHSRKKMVGGSHLQGYRKACCRKSKAKVKNKYCKSDAFRSRNNSLKLKQCLVY